MQKKNLFLLGILFPLILSAIPAKRDRCTLTLANGSKIEATSMGDEVMHFYQTDDGRCLQCDNEGIAHFVEPDTIRNRMMARTAKRKNARAKKYASRQTKSNGNMTGTKRGLVILVQFPGTSFYYTNADFQRIFNEEGYTDNVNIGSVHDYFYDASYGLFNFSFDVVGPITVSQPLSYYGSNNENGDDIYPATMVCEAVQIADERVDFSKYDWDEDGEVEQVFIIHSGFDEAQRHFSTDIWSHAWTLSEAMEEDDGDGPVTADGVVIDSYATCAEIRGTNGNAIMGIGTACHEFSHCFGLPDFYDVDGRNFGMNSWSLMDYGSYNGNGGSPACFTSYERMFCGWLEPTELTEAMEVNDMPALTSAPVAYLLRNSGKEDEYYLLENRQKESWDSYLGGHGLLVLHVDYDDLAWMTNAVNVIRSHQRMTIIPADNMLYSGTLSGDPWPGTTGKTELSRSSTPAATLYNLNAEGDLLMHHSIANITESEDGFINFVFDGGALGLNETHNPQPDLQQGIYDLSGRKVTGKVATLRICIQDRKKILTR